MPDGNGPHPQVLTDLCERQLQAWPHGERLLVESLASDVTPPLQENERLELIFADELLMNCPPARQA